LFFIKSPAKLRLMLNVEHIGIAVRSLEESVPLFEKLLGVRSFKMETVENDRVATAFFQVGESKIELLESLDPEGPVGRFIARKGEGVHHIALRVDDIQREMQRLREQGFTPLEPEARPGADNKLVCFLHPRDTCGVLVELCMERI
jgi:methylmalonyl-CoA/ethylmalonyl-CoA epimerase